MNIPNLTKAESPESRSVLLNEFIEFWLGPRKPEFGYSSSELSNISMPNPLRELYRFAGKWSITLNNNRKLKSPFCIQDHLRNINDLTTDVNGHVTFLDENQGVFECLTAKV